MMKLKHLLIAFSSLIFFACNDGMTEPETEKAVISILDSQAFESSGVSTLTFDINSDINAVEPIDVQYSVTGKTATPDVDFDAIEGSITIDAGSKNATLIVDIFDDEIKEVDEKVQVTISVSGNALVGNEVAIGIIKDNDEAEYDDEGYITSKEHYGYNLTWEDEFDASSLNLDWYNFEIGDGCPNLCGWGNNEIQQYTDLEENIRIEDSKLIITATEVGPQTYNSARIQTKDKREFKFGRIDVRAKMPTGQGLWPAIWMLGSNIDQVSWPVCGEIDIMELVGHQPKSSHGTAHWGAPGDTQSTYSTSAYAIEDEYSERFHVFSIVWEFNEIIWYVDETRFHVVDINSMQGKPYPFNQDFFFIFNVAVGGNWPGNPDDTSTFPQTMEIDYIRVFQ